MATYQVSFFKNLQNSYGQSFRCLQGCFRVSDATSDQQAALQAERQFEKLHQIPKWNLKADSIDISEIAERPEPAGVVPPTAATTPRMRLSLGRRPRAAPRVR